MGETALNFGPSWLRALSGGHDGGSPPPPITGGAKYKLADHRYGREEMLALVTHNSRPPATLDTDETFFHGKPRDPLSVEPMTDEEVALLQFGVNSDAAKSTVRPGQVTVGGGGGLSGGNGEISDMRGGIGAERGHRGAVRGGRGGMRGRGNSTSGLRGGLRNPSLDDDPDGKRGGPGNSWGNEWSDTRFGGGGPRNRSFERSQSFGERNNWGDRNGPGGGGGGTAGPGSEPRRGAGMVGGGGRGSSTAVDNWRQREGAGDENSMSANDWRHARGQEKWGTGQSSWRDREEERRGGGGGYMPTRGSWRGAGGRGGGGAVGTRRDRGYGMDDDEDYEDDEHGVNGGSGWSSAREREDGARHNEKSSSMGGARHGGRDASPSSSAAAAGSHTSGSPPSSPRAKDKDRLNDSREGRGGSAEGEGDGRARHVSGDGLNHPQSSGHRAEHSNRSANPSGDPSGHGSVTTHPSARGDLSSSKPSEQHPPPSLGDADPSVQQRQQQLRHPAQNQVPLGNPSNMGNGVPDAAPTSGTNAALSAKESFHSAGFLGLGDPGLQNPNPASKAAGSVSGSVGAELQPAPPPITWFYRDPSGVIQGPFSNQDMFDWNERGFFRDHLLVKRNIDEDYFSLGDMKARCGGNPFAVPPPLLPTQRAPQVVHPMRGAAMGPVGSVSDAGGAATSVPGAVGSSGLLPHMSGGGGGAPSVAPGGGVIPTSPLRAQNQNVPQPRVPTADFMSSSSHQQHLQSLNSGPRRMPTDSNLPQFLANIQMKQDQGPSGWKAPGVPPQSSSGMQGLSLDDRLPPSMQQENQQSAGLGFLQGLGGHQHQAQSHPQLHHQTQQPPPQQMQQQPQMHHPLGPQLMHKSSSTPVQQLLSNMLGQPQQGQGAQLPGMSQNVLHEQNADPSSNSLSALLQKLNMQPPQGPPQHQPQQPHHLQQQQQMSGYMDMNEPKDPSKMVGPPPQPYGLGHGHPMMPQQHMAQPRGPLSGLLPGGVGAVGMQMGHPGGMQQQHQQHQQQSGPQTPNDAFQNLLLQLKQQQQEQHQYQHQQPQPAPAQPAQLPQNSEAALAEERRRNEEIERRAKAVEEERKRLEQERLKWEEECRRNEERRLEDERKRKEEEERLKEARRVEEERLEAERRQMAFLQQQRRELEEELKRKEAERKKREEEERMQAAMEKKRQEEILRRAAEAEAMKKKLEEEQREKERRAQEAARMQAEAEEEEAERLRLEEIARLEMQEERDRAKGEALRAALLKNAVGGVPWGGKGPQQAVAPSLLEVQAQEEMERRNQQVQQQQQSQARVASPPSASRQQASPNDWNSGGVPLRWATQVQSHAEPEPKSLAEIQAEEEQKMKQFQSQREKQRAVNSANASKAQSRDAVASSSVGQAISWASKAASGMPAPPPPTVYGGGSGGAVANPSSSSVSAKPSASGGSGMGNFWTAVAKANVNPQPAPQEQQQPQQSKKQAAAAAAKAAAAAAAAASQNHAKQKAAPSKSEENVIKLFESQLPKPDDDFTKWCFDTLRGMDIEASIDIATFVGFLKDVESPFEVQDYGASYLGTSKVAREFIREFLERRSRWKNSLKSAKAPEDSMLGPAKAINPNAVSTQGSQVHYHSQGGGTNSTAGSLARNQDAFHEVKGKAKSKKGKKMQKVDNSILGFNVTAASDRVNVGDREFVDGM